MTKNGIKMTKTIINDIHISIKVLENFLGNNESSAKYIAICRMILNWSKTGDFEKVKNAYNFIIGKPKETEFMSEEDEDNKDDYTSIKFVD